ncbi:MAG: hypothetical protein E7660_07450 [Ruminococcaceae bacterium]|nr:hypothetical protein [Oscillospiraceae bacterium]
MKRFVCMLVVLSLLLLVSCTGKDIPGVTKQESGTVDSSTEEKGGNESEETEKTEKAVPYTFDKTATIEKQVLVDENGIKITAEEIDFSGFFGPKIVALVENNTSRDVTIQARDGSVNGGMVETNFTFDLIAGEKSREEIRFAKSDMELYGIAAVECLEFGLLVSDSRNWETVLNVDNITVNTSAEKTEWNYLEGYDEVLYGGGGIKICLNKKAAPSTPVGTKLTVGIENKTERSLNVKANGVKLDGISVGSVLTAEVLPDKTVVLEMSFSEWELKSLNVNGAKEMSLKFTVSDADTKETVFETEEITVYLAE